MPCVYQFVKSLVYFFPRTGTTECWHLMSYVAQKRAKALQTDENWWMVHHNNMPMNCKGKIKIQHMHWNKLFSLRKKQFISYSLDLLLLKQTVWISIKRHKKFMRQGVQSILDRSAINNQFCCCQENAFEGSVKKKSNCQNVNL